MIIIDNKKCIGCGACVKDCIVYNISMEEGKADAKGPCILCGHCVAVCPAKAVSMDDYKMDEVVEYKKDTFHLSSESLLNTIKFRRSIRDFKTEIVEEEKLQKILEAGRYTETGSNSQGVRFYIIQEELELFKKMVWESFYELAKDADDAGHPFGKVFLGYCEKYKENPQQDRLFFNAPMVMLVAAENPIDAGLASANMELMAVSQDLGVLFDGYVVHAVSKSKKIQDWLSLDEKQLVSCMLMGYPNVKYHRTAPRREADIIRK